MGQGVDEARRQRELTKAALAGDLDRLEARVRSELDWRARLTRERGRIVGIGVGVVVVVVGASVVFIVRRRFAPKRPKKSSMHPVTLAEVDAELHELRKLLEKKNGSSSSLVQKAVLRAISAAGTAGGTMVAREMIKRQKGSREGSETGRGG